jgi:type II secretory pathway component GspD/PulD (secretin)/tetratricopeptide (TPR) repeat protein
MISEEKTCESHAQDRRRTLMPSTALALSVLGLALASSPLIAQDAGSEVPPAAPQGEAPTEPADPPAEAEPAPQPAPAPETQEPTAAQKAASDARVAMSKSQWENAVAAWNRVLADAPGDAEAKAGLAKAQAAMDQASTIQGVQDDLNLRRQQSLIEFNADLTRADAQIDAGDYDGAQRTALTAKVRLDRNRGILPLPAYTEMGQRVETMLERISDAKINAELLQQELKRTQARTAASQEQRIEAANRERQIRENIIRVRQLQLELKYDEALQILEQILFMDPLNPAALALRDVIHTSNIYMGITDLNRQRAYAYEEFSVQAARSMVPPRVNTMGPGPKSTNGVVTYPEDWPQLSSKRLGASGYNESPANQMVQGQMQNPVSVNFNRNSLGQVINYMKTVTGAEIYADWKSLNTIGIRTDDEVTLELGRVTAEVALRRVLEQLGDNLDRPQFGVEDGMVVITTEDALRKRKVTLVYNISDLLLEVPYFDNAPDFDLGTAISGGPNQVSGSFGNGDDAPGEVFGGNSRGDDPRRNSRDELVDEIITIIQDVVDPERGWFDTSGEGGKIQELNGNLIITNTPRNHRAIEGLLNQLRTIRALQINVEARLLTVDMEWFESIGMDMDLYFNTNPGMTDLARQGNPFFELSDFFLGDNADGPYGAVANAPFFWTAGQTPTAPGVGSNPALPTTLPDGSLSYPQLPQQGVGRTQGWDPISVQQDSFGLVRQLGGALQGAVATAALANPALAVGISFLDDIQVDLLIEATQADQRNAVLTAPRLTLFNGQRSWISVAKGITYISNLTPVTGDSSGAFDPQTDVVYQGFVLDVEGVISSDRRYVTMTVSFNLNQDVSLEPVPITGAAGGGFAGGGAAQFVGFIQLPTLEGTQIRTTVSVPDKGTILLGGQRVVNEIEIEAGVPVLSKIPVVNRFFTNRMTSKQEKTMLLLIRPEIIIHQENEDDLFPGLGEQLGSGSSYLGF